jgi:hypothetical protein
MIALVSMLAAATISIIIAYVAVVIVLIINDKFR